MHERTQKSSRPRILRGLFGTAAFGAAVWGLVALSIAALEPPPTDKLSGALASNRPATGGGSARFGDGVVHLAGGTYAMGKDHASRDDESPAHDVNLPAFGIDAHEVTNGQFAAFVAATCYITSAEQQGWGLVLDAATGDWQRVAGADWQHPSGPESTIVGRDRHPVVQVTWHDARAYADWASGRLPSEAEWEYAARSGLRDTDYPWGPSEQADGAYHANYHQGWFPTTDAARDGFAGLAVVGSFAPARNGLWDMAGNVAEWCDDCYADDYYRHSPAEQPRGPTSGPERVVRGGSYLSPEVYCPAYRVTARDRATPDTRRADLGFRCVYGVH